MFEFRPELVFERLYIFKIETFSKSRHLVFTYLNELTFDSENTRRHLHFRTFDHFELIQSSLANLQGTASPREAQKPGKPASILSARARGAGGGG